MVIHLESVRHDYLGYLTVLLSIYVENNIIQVNGGV